MPLKLTRFMCSYKAPKSEDQTLLRAAVISGVSEEDVIARHGHLKRFSVDGIHVGTYETSEGSQ